MAKLILLFFILCSLFITDCASAKKTKTREAAAPAVANSFRENLPGPDYRIVDYQGKNRGMPLPWWVEPYLNSGVAVLEEQRGAHLSQSPFAGKYVFVSMQKSANLPALLQWKNSFQNNPAFSAMIFPRIYRRTVQGIPVNPERYYGPFFGVFLKEAADIGWPEAELVDSVWLIMETGADGNIPAEQAAGGSVETNAVLTLAVIDKAVFQRRLESVINRITGSGYEQTREQRAAVNRLKSSFFDRF